MSQGPTHRSRTKHIDLTLAPCRDYVMRGRVRLEHCSTFAQIADMFTKQLGPSIFLLYRARFMSWQESGCSVESIRVVRSVSPAWEAVELTLGGCLHLPVRSLRPYLFGSDNRGCSRTNAWQFSTFPRRRLPAFLVKLVRVSSVPYLRT
jgi:hypothetical protein